jgi:hypothetical protein
MVSQRLRCHWGLGSARRAVEGGGGAVSSWRRPGAVNLRAMRWQALPQGKAKTLWSAITQRS